MPRERPQEPDGHRLLGPFWGRGDMRMLLLAPLLGHGRQGKSVPGHGASSDGHWLWKGAVDPEAAAFLGGAPIWEEPQEQQVPPATSSAGLVWEQHIERQLVV